MKGLRYLLFTGILAAAVSFSSYNCGDDVESGGTGADNNETTDVYNNPKDSGHKDIGLEERLVYPDANGDDDFDAGRDTGFDSGEDSGRDGGYDGGDSGFDAQFLDSDDVQQIDAGEDGGTDACCDASLDSGYDAEFSDGNDDVLSYDAGMDGSLDASLDGGVDSDYDSGLDGSVDDIGVDAGSDVCDSLYPSDWVIPAVYNMKIPLTDFLKYFSTITGIDKMKNLEGQITSDVLLQAVPFDASSMYEIVSGSVLFETDSGICEMDFVKDEVNNAYWGAYNK